MPLPSNKTRIICTIGPASEAPDVMLQMIKAGMNIARLNFSHGDFGWHAKTILNLREVARKAKQKLAIMADLPGPKIRIGNLKTEPIELERDDLIRLTTDDIVGTKERISVSLPQLPKVVKPGNIIYLNDGIIQLEVVDVHSNDVHCRVLRGGELRSHKGLNLPGIDLGMCAFTAKDKECLEFALKNGVDAISQSFVNNASDVEAVRKAAHRLGYHPFIIAKIERAGALSNINEIMDSADGIMIARGDLGVETQIERIAIVQKELTHMANKMGKPVITATQMLESMVENFRPTRAESTDVANAILDGTDCIMLSEESAMGRFPVEAASVLSRIAAATEPHRSEFIEITDMKDCGFQNKLLLPDVISHNVKQTVEFIDPAVVLVHTQTGYTARMISRFKLPVWIAAVSKKKQTCQNLMFTYGILPIHIKEIPSDWNAFAQDLLKNYGLEGTKVVLTEGPSPDNPRINPRVEIINLEHYHQEIYE
jgi:pyruvate kinase